MIKSQGIVSQQRCQRGHLKDRGPRRWERPRPPSATEHVGAFLPPPWETCAVTEIRQPGPCAERKMASGQRDVLRTERREQSDTIGIVAKEREIGVLESGGDRASDEAVGAPRSGRLPPVCWRDLNGLSRPSGRAHHQHVDLSDGGRRKKQNRGRRPHRGATARPSARDASGCAAHRQAGNRCW